MWNKRLRDAVEWALMVALVFGAGAIAQAQQEETPAGGRIVQIGPADAGGPGETANEASDDTIVAAPTEPDHPAESAAAKYWIGLLGGPVTPDLRYHLDLPEDHGVMVHDVVPDSPAAAAGLTQFDIVLTANDKPVRDMRDLVELVGSEGAAQRPIVLDVLRHGQHELVSITPAERPQQFAGERGQMEGWGDGPRDGSRDMLRGFARRFGGREGGPLEFRSFGPGVVVGPHAFGMAEIPNGVSVSIQRDNDQPAHVTVKRGDEVWEIDGDDSESLSQLPDDLRPFVEQMLHGGTPLGVPVPEMRQFGEGVKPYGQELRGRLEAMEQQLHELQRQFRGPDTEAHGDAQ